MAGPQHILAIRFSALGDVAMTVPVLKCLLQQHPHLEITMVSVPFHAPLFFGIERLHFYAADVKNKYKGISGLWQLSMQIKKDVKYAAIADLHDVLRTKILRTFLGGKIAVINKGRKQKKELTKYPNKKLRQLPTTFERYAKVFQQLGYPVSLQKECGIISLPQDNKIFNKENNILIGVAPFARHQMKMYPLQKMKTVVENLSSNKITTILLFGSKAEAEILQSWKDEHPNIHIIAGNYSFQEELNIISQLQVMVSMDSANMHLASLYGVPVVSVWGGTHPYMGFYGWGQHAHNAVQINLPCRPSSVFGKAPCPVHGINGCMQDVSPQMIIQKVQSVLYNS